jgi:hypothetical protein
MSRQGTSAAEDKGFEMSLDEAKEIVYRMPYDEWKAKYQTEATSAQQAAYKEARHRAPI